MEGQGGEKEEGVKKGMPYSGSNSREQVKTDMVLIADIPACTNSFRMTSCWSPIPTFFQFLERIYEESLSGTKFASACKV